MDSKVFKSLIELDARLVQCAKNIKLLSALAWPSSIQDEFLRLYEDGKAVLPKVSYAKVDYSLVCTELRAIAKLAPISHPIGMYLQQTAASYCLAARMLENLGTPFFTEISTILYGKTRGGVISNLAFSEEIISLTTDFIGVTEAEQQYSKAHCVLPDVVADEIQKRANDVLGVGKVRVIVDSALLSKAAAGAERIRIRAETSFSEWEVSQLIEHELMVHTLTAINGRLQPNFKSFGLGSPRTTCTQEGLATFAELISASMDLNRLRRLALRIKGIDIALGGADFVEVFKFFLGSGQSVKESFQSASRIFRGADIRGTHVFTKDVVYLKGLFSVHTFLRKSMVQRKFKFPEHLFIGRLSLSDVTELEPYIDGKWLQPATYRPHWVSNAPSLAAYLSYAAVANKLNLGAIQFSDLDAPPIALDLL